MGSGGREHALAWKLAQSARCEELHAAPGNPGIATIGHCHPVRAEDGEGLLAFCGEHEIDLVVVGPEAPLVAGMADLLRDRGHVVFGCSRAAAEIEGSKAFAKELMARHGTDNFVLSTWSKHFDPLTTGYDAQAYEVDKSVAPIDYAAGDELVFRYTASNTTKAEAWIPNGDGKLSNGRIPNITLPK